MGGIRRREIKGKVAAEVVVKVVAEVVVEIVAETAIAVVLFIGCGGSSKNRQDYPFFFFYIKLKR